MIRSNSLNPSYRLLEDSLPSFLTDVVPLIFRFPKRLPSQDLHQAARRLLASTIYRNLNKFYEPASTQNLSLFASTVSAFYQRRLFSLRYLISKPITTFVFCIDFFCIFLFSISKPTDKNFTVYLLHHEKYVSHALCSPTYLDGTSQAIWLTFGRHRHIQTLVPSQDVVLRLPRSSFFPIPSISSHLLSDFFKLLFSLKLISPDKLVTFEGDASQHSLAALACRSLNITSNCYQWGIFDSNWMHVAFTGMTFDNFFSWGPYFTAQLLSHNHIGTFIHTSPPFSVSLGCRQSYPSLLFIDQGPDHFFNSQDRHLFISLCKRLSLAFPRRIAFRPHPTVAASELEIQSLSASGVSIESATLPILSVLPNYHFATAISSSALVECIFSNVVPIRLQTASFPSFPVPIPYDNVGHTLLLNSSTFDRLAFILNSPYHSTPSHFAEYQRYLFGQPTTIKS